MAQNENEFGEYSETPEGEQRPNAVQQLREELARVKDKHKEDLDKARNEAKDAALKEVERKGQATEIGTKLGFPKAADLYLEKHPEGDITEEGFRSFLTDTVGVEVKPPEGEGQESGQAEPPQPQPAAVGTGNVAAMHQVGGTPGTQQRYTAREIYEAFSNKEIDRAEFNRRVEASLGLNPPPV